MFCRALGTGQMMILMQFSNENFVKQKGSLQCFQGNVL